MENINDVFAMLDWNRSEAEQAEGIRLSSEVEDFSIFFQPCKENFGKNIWGNCAIILSKKSDEELSRYLPKLFEWIQDMNWPGADCIMERLLAFEPKKLAAPFINCYHKAVEDEDVMWIYGLKMVLADSSLSELLPEKVVEEIKRYEF